MDDSTKTAINEIVSYLSEGGEYKEYDFHLKYGLSPFLIDKAINYLSSMNVLKSDSERYFKINNEVDEKNLMLLGKVLSKRNFKINDGYGRSTHEALNINEPYLPNKKLLDTKISSV
tara:strand:+ start:6579 stop:6929 length:351 start_codon:yes stop_codon:yes gene_type:complete